MIKEASERKEWGRSKVRRMRPPEYEIAKVGRRAIRGVVVEKEREEEKERRRR